MKKIVLMLILALAFVGCGSNNEDKAVSAGTNYAAVINDKSVSLNDQFDKDAYGEPLDFYEAVSCGFEGMDRIYTYENYEVYTYPQGDKDYVLEIDLLGDTKTEEGIGAGSTKEAVIKAYGEDYTEQGNMLVYTEGKNTVNFQVKDDVVQAVSYIFLP